MGTYTCGVDEIYDAIETALDNLQGEVFPMTYVEAAEKITRKYKHFTETESINFPNKPKLKIGDRVYVEYKYQHGLEHVKKLIYGKVARVYPTTFGGVERAWGVSINLDLPHPLYEGHQYPRYKSTFRANKVFKVKK